MLSKIFKETAHTVAYMFVFTLAIFGEKRPLQESTPVTYRRFT